MTKEKTLLHWTKGSGKMADFWSLNTSASANPYCQAKHHEVCERCYAERFEGFRKGLQVAFTRNYDLLNAGPLSSEDLKVPSKIAGPAIRLHSYGELGSKVHAWNFLRLAEANPWYEFTLWTKRPELLGEAYESFAPELESEPTFMYFPQNLHVLWSVGGLNWSKDRVVNALNTIRWTYPFVKGAYYVGTKDAGFKPCGSKCATCLRCYPPVCGDTIQQLLH